MHLAGHLASRGLMGSERLARCEAFSLLISRLITQDTWQLARSAPSRAGGPGYHSRAGGSGRQQHRPGLAPGGTWRAPPPSPPHGAGLWPR